MLKTSCYVENILYTEENTTTMVTITVTSTVTNPVTNHYVEKFMYVEINTTANKHFDP